MKTLQSSPHCYRNSNGCKLPSLPRPSWATTEPKLAAMGASEAQEKADRGVSGVQKCNEGWKTTPVSPQELLGTLLCSQTKRLFNLWVCKNSKASGRKGWQEKASVE